MRQPVEKPVLFPLRPELTAAKPAVFLLYGKAFILHKKGGIFMQSSLKSLSWDDAPDILKPQEAAKLLRIGKNKIYEVANSEGFPKLYMGERIFVIPKEALRQWIQKTATHK